MTEVIRPSSESSSQLPHQYNIHQITNLSDFIKQHIGNLMQLGRQKNCFRRAGENICFCVSKESSKHEEELFLFFKSLIVALASKGEYLDGLSKVILKSGKSLYHHMVSGSIKMGDFQNNSEIIDLGQRKKLPDNIPQKNILNQSGVNRIMMQFHKEDHKDITADMLFFSLFYEKNELHIIHGFHIENLFKIQAFLQGQQIPSSQDFKVSKYTAQVCVAQDVESENFNPFEVDVPFDKGAKNVSRYIQDSDKNNQYFSCKKGEKIAEITLLNFPKNGRDIFGNILPIPNEYHTHISQILGENVFLSQEAGKIYVVSGCDGVICYTGGNKQKVAVKENYELNIPEKSEKNLEFHGREITLCDSILNKNITIQSQIFLCHAGEISGSELIIRSKECHLNSVVSSSQLTFTGEKISIQQIGTKVTVFAPNSDIYVNNALNESCIYGGNIVITQCVSPDNIFATEKLSIGKIQTKSQDMFVFGQNISIDEKIAQGEGDLYIIRLDRQDEDFISQLKVQKGILQEELMSNQQKHQNLKKDFEGSPNGKKYLQIQKYLICIDEGIYIDKILQATKTKDISQAQKVLEIQISKIFYESGKSLINLKEFEEKIELLERQIAQIESLLAPVSWSVGMNKNEIGGAVSGKAYYTTFSMTQLQSIEDIQALRGIIKNYRDRINLDKNNHRMCEKSFCEKSDENPS